MAEKKTKDAAETKAAKSDTKPKAETKAAAAKPKAAKSDAKKPAKSKTGAAKKATRAKTKAKASGATAKPKVTRKKSTKEKSSKTLRVEQIGSPIRREASQRQTLIGLKLNKLHRVSELEDTPSIRGMITKVAHLVRVLDDAA